MATSLLVTTHLAVSTRGARTEHRVYAARRQSGYAAVRLKAGRCRGDWRPSKFNVIPTNFDWYVLIAEKTGLPALARRLEELPHDVPVFAIAMVDSEVDCVSLAVAGRTHVTWSYRAKGEMVFQLIDALYRLLPSIGDGHALAACEASTAPAP